MAIDISQIHNLVRTYQRALRDNDEPHREAEARSQSAHADRVSLSQEARARRDEATAASRRGGQKG